MRYLTAAAGAVLLVIPLTAATSSASAGTRRQDAAFYGFVAQVRRALAPCANRAQAVQLDLALVLAEGAKATTSDVVDLDNMSKTAQTYCDEAKDQTILHLGGFSVPGAISWIQGLGDVPIESTTWATDDTNHVLHDVQLIVEATGSTVALDSQLQQDVAQADSDAHAIEGAFNHAAHRLGVRHYASPGFVYW
ncbi:MAG: hypothetical protein JWM85_2350 [Acidimicrobiaceae bacterium]|nr:hypothetical protein [Acidimicrobiaceae bacterium]